MKLSELLKPKSFEDIVGQEHLLSGNTAFMQLIRSADFESIIFTGPSGTGKTSVAELIGEYLTLPFYRLHAASSGAADIRNIVETTKHYGKPAVIFVDEIHRFTKTQQDLLLDVVDGKHGKLIGASTENPYYNLTSSLRSRSAMFKFKKISKNSFVYIFSKVQKELRERYDVDDVIIEDREFDILINSSNGDLRRFLNFVEMISSVGVRENNKLYIKLSDNDDSFMGLTYSEDEHYDLFSALIKSIRGSDPDAALVWGVKIINSGVGPEQLFRRLLVSASEDIGNAFPDALVFVQSAYEAFDRVGMPEGRIIISHVITFLASCPKSNRSYLAWAKADAYVKQYNPYPPVNIRHKSDTYKYPFDHGEFVKQQYKDTGDIFYNPSSVGFEKKISERLSRLWNGIKNYE